MPNHLPAHAHSDLFSFDIFKNGNPIIAECGQVFMVIIQKENMNDQVMLIMFWHYLKIIN